MDFNVIKGYGAGNPKKTKIIIFLVIGAIVVLMFGGVGGKSDEKRWRMTTDLILKNIKRRCAMKQRRRWQK